MKKNNGLAILGLLLMFLKSNLFLIEGTAFYFYTNVIGALVFTLYLYRNKRTKFILPTMIYVAVNFILYFTETYQLSMLPVGSSFFLLLDSSLFLFPIIAFLFYLTGFSREEKLVKFSITLMTISLILTIINGFIIFTGAFLSLSLVAIQLLTVIVLILEGISVILLFSYLLRKEKFKEVIN